MTDCPCGSGRAFEDCCAPLLAGRPAPTAEALMRSRYTAFVRSDMDYIERTQAAELNDRSDPAESARAANQVRWQRLEVLDASEDGNAGVVEFRAHFRQQGRDLQLHERSMFRRQNGRWLYVGGDVAPKAEPRRAAKVGRNQPCPCGSGKKYKICCGR